MSVHGKKPPLATGRFLLLLLFLFFYYNGITQSISLRFKNVPLEKAFRELETKISQRFVYTREMMEQSHPVSIEIENATLATALNKIFDAQPLEYLVDDQFIKVRFKKPVAAPDVSLVDVHGLVTNEKGEPLPNVSVIARLSGRFTITGADGSFILKQLKAEEEILFTSIGYAARNYALNGKTQIEVQLSIAVSELDKALVIAYGTTTQRVSTGSISKVGAETIGKQPVSNAIAALQGRVPGVTIVQSSGIPGAAFKVSIRGQSSIAQGSDPLYIIDGVPYAPGAGALNLISNAAGSGSGGIGGLSPFNLINPADIESIEVLKDADATAIYGSRGANGVILITTKKGVAGKTKFSVNVYEGFSRVARSADMLTTPQYLQMRREAFANDGIAITSSAAPDLVVWDTMQYTNFKKLLIGGTAHTMDVQASLSGGNAATQFLMGTGYHSENTVFPGDLSNNRLSFLLNLKHRSTNNKFFASLSATYAKNKSKLIANDLTGYINLTPHIHLYDASGNLNWKESGTTFRSMGMVNPLAYLSKKYNGDFDNLLTNLQLNYSILPGLQLKVSLGYNKSSGSEIRINPRSSIDPNTSTLASSNFGNSHADSWIAEPQLQYTKKMAKGKLEVLAGTTWQENMNSSLAVMATNYTSDILLQSVNAAGLVTSTNGLSQYKYNAAFGRINYNLADKYIVNLSARRDGSSRFGPGNRFNNFGAAGLAWLFANEKWVKKQLAFINYGKIRVSYGITGNDQIGDYKYLNSWTPFTPPYQSIPGFTPSALFNPAFAWERNTKFEAAIELGFFNNRLLVTTAFYRHRSGNQLINYTLPIQTGFSSILKNIDAVIENAGVEMVVQATMINNKNFNWASTINLTAPRNKLLSFPNLALSSYASSLVEDESMTVLRLYHFVGVDVQSGIYQFEDKNKDGQLNLEDRIIKNVDPKFYGGFQNNFSYKSLDMELFFEFKKQLGHNYLYDLSFNVPGYGYTNQPVIVLNRWQKPGDVTDVQRFTASSSSQAFAIATGAKFTSSDAVYTDASFIRCKNIALAYRLPACWLKKMHLENMRLYLQAQNLFTITSYIGADPENQSLYILPPLKTVVAGLQFQF